MENIAVIIHNHQNHLKFIIKCQDTLSDIAAETEKNYIPNPKEDPEGYEREHADVEKLQDCYRRYIAMEAKVKAHTTAMREVQSKLRTDVDLDELFHNEVEKNTKHYRKPEDYFENNRYKDFKTRIHSVHHSDEPLPWEEDDIVVRQSQSEVSVMCPLTRAPFAEPVKSNVCNHTFSKYAIEAYLFDKRRGQHVSKPCPVAGCNKYVTISNLEKDLVAEAQVEQWNRKNAQQQNRGGPELPDVEALDLDEEEDLL